MFAMATCASDHLEIDFRHLDPKAYAKISKNNFGILIVLLDMLIVVLYIIFVSRLE